MAPNPAMSMVVPPDCHESEYNKLLDNGVYKIGHGRPDEAAIADYKAALIRYKCAQHVKGEELAFFLNDFAERMEDAAWHGYSANDFTYHCAVLFEENGILRSALTQNKFKPEDVKILNYHLSNTHRPFVVCRKHFVYPIGAKMVPIGVPINLPRDYSILIKDLI